MNLYLLFHYDFCTSVNNYGSMLFHRLKIGRMGRSKHLLVQIQWQDTRKNTELCPELIGVLILNFE